MFLCEKVQNVLSSEPPRDYGVILAPLNLKLELTQRNSYQRVQFWLGYWEIRMCKMTSGASAYFILPLLNKILLSFNSEEGKLGCEGQYSVLLFQKWRDSVTGCYWPVSAPQGKIIDLCLKRLNQNQKAHDLEIFWKAQYLSAQSQVDRSAELEFIALYITAIWVSPFKRSFSMIHGIHWS